MSAITEKLVRFGFTSSQASILEELFPEVLRNSDGELTGYGVDDDKSKLPVQVSQSYAPVTRSSDNSTDTTGVALAVIPIPVIMNRNGKLNIEVDWKVTSSAISKSLRLYWGGVWVADSSATTAVRTVQRVSIKNANSLTSQFLLNNPVGSAATAHTTGAVDTSAEASIELRCAWASNVASEEITLLGYSIWYEPGND